MSICDIVWYIMIVYAVGVLLYSIMYMYYIYIMSQVYVVYSCMLYYYMLLYSYYSLDLVFLDLVLRGSMRYTIMLCLYMHLYMYDSLILYDCYILICLVYILICVFIASAGSLPNIEHLFGQQCSTVLLCCQAVQIKAIARLVGIELCYRWVEC